jgi:hypothetical protein
MMLKIFPDFLPDFEGKFPGFSGFERPDSGFWTVASGNPVRIPSVGIRWEPSVGI